MNKKKIQEIVIIGKDESPSSSQYLLESIKKMITDNGDEILNSQYCGVRTFKTALRKNGRKVNQTKGAYLWILYTNNNKTDFLLNTELKLNNNILRTLIVNVDAKSPVLSKEYICPLTQREIPDLTSRNFASQDRHGFSEK